MSEAAMQKIMEHLQKRYGTFTLDESPVTGYTCLIHQCSATKSWLSPIDPGVTLADLMVMAAVHIGEAH